METFCMCGLPRPMRVRYGNAYVSRSGYPSVIVLADAILKNVTSFGRPTGSLDGVPERALWQMRRTGDVENHVNNSKWIPAGRAKAVSHALEVAIADACIARVAARLGDGALAKKYAKRSTAYTDYWDNETSAFQGRARDGSFVRRRLETYDRTGYLGEIMFEEGSPLQYSLAVPHDISGLIRLYGGRRHLRDRLEYYFFNSTFGPASESPVDLQTGFVGGHCHGNEPGHHTPYIFNAVGAPWLAQKALDAIMDLYTAKDAGLPGNDDVGQMSAWFVWATLGSDPG